MNLKGFYIDKTATFTKAQKELSKKYKNCDKDVENFINSLYTDKDLGISLGDGFYKVRLSNSDKIEVKVQVIESFHI